MAYIFDGRKFAQKKEEEIKSAISHRFDRAHGSSLQGVTPKLAVILVGDNEASRIYVNLKKKAAERVGIEFQLIEMPNATKETLLHLIKAFNEDSNVHGIMVQLPLPKELDGNKDEILESIYSEKDVDGLREDSQFLSAAARAVLHAVKAARNMGYLDRHWDEITACVVGASGMVGKPVVRDLKQKGTKVLECDVNTRDLAKAVAQADLLISATGVPNLVKRDMVKKGAVVIDVGSPHGDIEFEEISKIASFVTPVPGGIGPVTVVCLLENTLHAASKK